MPLRDPARAIRVLLNLDGPQTAAWLEDRVDGAGNLILDLERAGEVEQRSDRWTLLPAGRVALAG